MPASAKRRHSGPAHRPSAAGVLLGQGGDPVEAQETQHSDRDGRKDVPQEKVLALYNGVNEKPCPFPEASAQTPTTMKTTSTISSATSMTG